MSTSNQDQFEESLRSQLMGAQNGSSSHAHPPSQSASGPPPYPIGPRSPPSSDGQIDPSIGGGSGPSPPQNPYLTPMVMEDMAMGVGGNNNKRELSSTKRAAQNRAAQRAFRQRKEAYISKLEKQVKDYGTIEEDFKALQHENYQLREYILALQTRILESSEELPPPPPRIHLLHPHEAQRHQALQAQQAAQQAAQQQHHQQQPQHQPQQHQEQQPSPYQSPVHDTSQDRHTDTAPIAAMTTDRIVDDMSASAVEQLQAAAAEAGIIEGEGSKQQES